ncbi:response regulator [Dyadobacter luticola]|uniref:response regulator n=1 Tax=Dyadobacter luticola TaxID=1979387 RepID=UPI0035B67A15
MITERLLERHGFTVVTRHNGKDCVEAAEQLRPDVILTDVNMPVMDGITACNLIRQHSWGQQIAIIALPVTFNSPSQTGYKNLVLMRSCKSPQNFKKLLKRFGRRSA